VPTLTPLANAGLVVNKEEQMAKDAIRAIQARLGEVEAGRLSMADPSAEAGKLSVTAQRGGQSEVRKQRN
jgi:hypothetical protein